jgi:zinc transporter, ZIP family
MDPATWPLWLLGFLGSFAAGLATGLGALPIFVRRKWPAESTSMMLAVAGGIMLAATVFSLIVPALEIAGERSPGVLEPALVVAAGILLGAIAIYGVHSVVPHEHFAKDAAGHHFLALGRNWLFIVAITLHNIPEGLSVGVAFGAGISSGLPVAIGIGIQNMPEGLAVAAALTSDGASRLRAFTVAVATGLVEPIGGLIGAIVVNYSDALLPWGLAFAAGAMLFVIVGEVIPESYRDDRHHGPTMALMGGFLVMMVVDVTLG